MEALLQNISELKNLTKLDFSESNISLESLNLILKQTPNITELNLSGCKNLDKSKAEALLQNISELKNLTKLDFSGSNISPNGLSLILKQTPNITELNLSGCQALASKLPESVDFSHLRILNLSQSNISHQNLFLIIKKAVEIEDLSLKECSKLEAGPQDSADEDIENDPRLRKLVKLDVSSSTLPRNTLALICNLSISLKYSDISYSKESKDQHK